jgi:proteic killer suppression protein
MIQSFRSKALARFWNDGDPDRGDPKGVRGDLRDRVRRVLASLDAVQVLAELPPGLGTHPLKGKAKRWGMEVNAQWRITFEWRDGSALRVDLEQYH